MESRRRDQGAEAAEKGVNRHVREGGASARGRLEVNPNATVCQGLDRVVGERRAEEEVATERANADMVWSGPRQDPWLLAASTRLPADPVLTTDFVGLQARLDLLEDRDDLFVLELASPHDLAPILPEPVSFCLGQFFGSTSPLARKMKTPAALSARCGSSSTSTTLASSTASMPRDVQRSLTAAWSMKGVSQRQRSGSSVWSRSST